MLVSSVSRQLGDLSVCQHGNDEISPGHTHARPAVSNSAKGQSNIAGFSGPVVPVVTTHLCSYVHRVAVDST